MTMQHAEVSHWSFKKEIQIGHVITTLTVAFSAFVYVTKIENRVSLLESQAMSASMQQRDRDERQDKANTEMMNMLRTQLERMELKIDRLTEPKK